MGYCRHHAVVLTSWSAERLAEAHAVAVDLGCSVTEITSLVVNGYRSFMVAPDGGQEGWESSEAGWRRRCALIDWLRDPNTSGSYIEWVEVQFGDDNNQSRVTRSGDLDAEGVQDVEEVY